VQDWKEIFCDVKYAINNARAILGATPTYRILTSNTVSMIAIAVLYQVKLEPTTKAGVAANVFRKWAWNFTIEGDLKREPGLTLAERRHWQDMMQRRPAEGPASTSKRPSPDVIELHGREKRTKIADEGVKSSEIDGQAPYVTHEELDKAKKEMKQVSGMGNDLRLIKY
jgi:hypothetical protein